ncbi:hypothetical protein HPP92_006049 [Vanilla planifolia]|uniref:Uncharacterized protein n=1 Tax=Vanilla planifolia TaxID=51239 RepID=A0A835VFG1_VANPL|nr:hypothetical protein HPP92_006049 [Vanilla planifolia]
MAELQEWEVMWPEEEEDAEHRPMLDERTSEPVDHAWCGPKREGAAPVSIPSRRHHHEEEEEEGELPPHVLVSRRWRAASMALSLCSGPGGTLKGRDLSHIRTSVLRMTGFLEA